MVDSIDLSLPLRKRIFSSVMGSESPKDFSPARRRLMSSSKEVPWIRDEFQDTQSFWISTMALPCFFRLYHVFSICPQMGPFGPLLGTKVSRGMKKPRKIAAMAVFGACVVRGVWHQARHVMMSC